MIYKATILIDGQRETKEFPSMYEAARWLDSKNNNLNATTIIESFDSKNNNLDATTTIECFDNSGKKTEEFVYTEKAT